MTVKSIHKDGVKENIQENQRGVSRVMTVPKIYESALKIQNYIAQVRLEIYMK